MMSLQEKGSLPLVERQFPIRLFSCGNFMVPVYGDANNCERDMMEIMLTATETETTTSAIKSPVTWGPLLTTAPSSSLTLCLLIRYVDCIRQSIMQPLLWKFTKSPVWWLISFLFFFVLFSPGECSGYKKDNEQQIDKSLIIFQHRK